MFHHSNLQFAKYTHSIDTDTDTDRDCYLESKINIRLFYKYCISIQCGLYLYYVRFAMDAINK